MKSLRLYPIKLELVSKMFTADESFASSLRELASDILPKTIDSRNKISRLAKLWRSTEKSGDTKSKSPSQKDIDRLLRGLAIAPERQPQAWQIFECWVRGISYSHWTAEVPEEVLTRLETQGTKLGIPAEYGLSELFINKLEIPLSEYLGLQNSYVDYQFVEGFYLNWKEILSDISETENQILTDLLVFFRNILNYADEPEVLLFYS